MSDTEANSTPSRPAYQLRVIAEKAELDAKIDKLASFVHAGESGSRDKLDAAEEVRLSAQLSAMWKYSIILGQRIAAFS